MTNLPPSERAAVVATIDPDVYTAAAYTSDWVPMAEYKSLMAVIMAGTLGASATLDAKLQEATSAAGAGNVDITGKVITQVTQAGTDGSDKQYIIECRDDELSAGFTHVALVVTVAVATSDVGALVLGFDKDSSERADLASVTEII
jgi:hypothetical protein